jgi:putative ABC transport system substrate-binding protein
VIYAHGDISILGAMATTKTIPVVVIASAPVEFGWVQSLARPGGNLTGVVSWSAEEYKKAVLMLRGIRPGLARVGVPMVNGDPGSEVYFDLWARAAEAQGVRSGLLKAVAAR